MFLDHRCHIGELVPYVSALAAGKNESRRIRVCQSCRGLKICCCLWPGVAGRQCGLRRQGQGRQVPVGAGAGAEQAIIWRKCVTGAAHPHRMSNLSFHKGCIAEKSDIGTCVAGRSVSTVYSLGFRWVGNLPRDMAKHQRLGWISLHTKESDLEPVGRPCRERKKAKVQELQGAVATLSQQLRELSTAQARNAELRERHRALSQVCSRSLPCLARGQSFPSGALF